MQWGNSHRKLRILFLIDMLTDLDNAGMLIFMKDALKWFEPDSDEEDGDE